MSHPDCHLSINQLELYVHLGWPEDERACMQTVIMDMKIHFFKPPLACASDKLDDTFCYAKLIDAIRKHIGDRHFFLIEHLSAELYQFIQSQLPGDAKLAINVSKFPAIKGLTGGVSFQYGE